MKEYGPEGFWWEQMMRAGVKVEPGIDFNAHLRDSFDQWERRQPLGVVRPLGILLCMRHRKRASECGCLAGGY